ncbi:hypothetical protein NEMBOFW57_003718 [Staphylotrichum longicolle]|uniref:Uncharacterized protein n=1 Tax=Staphylotrichum longicolle TaxID=669026 RepID=A0AAD4FAG0_9PEZI|nr:hypothetical protein NEMBOFW57_003718 [Staphylotrichum longicolle]
MTRDDYEQYEAAHPHGIKLDPNVFPKFLHDAEYLSDDEGNGGNEGDDTFACPSPPSQLEAWADDDHANPSPYKRPANPEPTTPRDHSDNTIYLTTPTSAYPDATYDASCSLTSPYRRRSTPDSWTGLELTAWGQTTAAPGAATPTRHPLRPSEPELKLTTAEGEEWWLDDGCEEYTYEYVYEDQAEGGYGHRCGEACGEFYYHDYDQYQAQDDGGFWMREGECDGVMEGEVQEVQQRLGEGTLEERREEKELPMWMRDPWHVSNMSWADMADEEEEW